MGFQHLAIVASVCVGFSALIKGQDLEPRAYSNSPTGLSFLLFGLGHTEGSVLTDPALPVDNVSIESNFGLAAFATTLDIFGKSGKIDVVLPYASLLAEGLVLGRPHVREVDGFADPAIRLSVIFVGAPALTVEEFASYKQDLIVGASMRIGVPLGQYDEDRLVNVGSNRWSFKPEIGISKAIGAWTFEVAPAVALYTVNHSFFNGHSREQDPLYSVQTHISYTFQSGGWIGLDGAYFNGGSTTVDGVANADRQEGLRFGVTIAVPITRHHSAKFYAITGFNGEGDHDFDALGVAWQYRWGGGF